jgi:hypothetical protein
MGRKKKRLRILARQTAAAPAPVVKETPTPVAEVTPAPKKSVPAPVEKAVEKKTPLKSVVKKTTKKS